MILRSTDEPKWIICPVDCLLTTMKILKSNECFSLSLHYCITQLHNYYIIVQKDESLGDAVHWMLPAELITVFLKMCDAASHSVSRLAVLKKNPGLLILVLCTTFASIRESLGQGWHLKLLLFSPEKPQLMIYLTCGKSIIWPIANKLPWHSSLCVLAIKQTLIYSDPLF